MTTPRLPMIPLLPWKLKHSRLPIGYNNLYVRSKFPFLYHNFVLNIINNLLYQDKEGALLQFNYNLQYFFQISEASFVTSLEDACRVDQCTQTPPSGKPRPRTLQRYHTSDHIYERSPHRYRLKHDSRPKSLLTDSYPFIAKPPSYEYSK